MINACISGKYNDKIEYISTKQDFISFNIISKSTIYNIANDKYVSLKDGPVANVSCYC